MKKKQLEQLQASLRAAAAGTPAQLQSNTLTAPQRRADVDAVRHETAADLAAVRDLHDLAALLGGELRKLAVNVAYSENPSSELRTLTASLKDLSAVVSATRTEARTTIQDALSYITPHADTTPDTSTHDVATHSQDDEEVG